MVYRRRMSSLLSFVWLAASLQQEGVTAEPPPIPARQVVTGSEAAESPDPAGQPAKPGPAAAAPPEKPAQAPPESPAREPAGDVVDQAAPLPAEGAAPAKPVPRQQLSILPQDPRMDAYGQFRQLYETAHFEQALPFAQRVVELSEADPERDRELPIAYNNLGATQYQLGDYKGATESYRTSLELLETTQGISSRRLVVPLAGLGAVYAAQDEHALAADLLDRALAVSRRANGLFNLEQLPLIEQVADSRYVLNDYAAVEKERMYALKIAEQNYGYGDERTLPSLLRLATFYESLREFIAARMMYLRARDICYEEGGSYDPNAVKSLVGIARSHRLQYTMDPETLDSQQPARDEITGEVVGKVWRESRVPPPAADRTGLKSVKTALDLLRSVPEPPKDLLTETLIEMGDWYQTTSRPNFAMPYYAEAATIYAAQQADDPLLGNPLMAPRMVYYRPPVSARRGLNTLTGKYVIRKATFSFVVSAEGQPQDIEVESNTMSESQLGQAERAISRAIYSPRFERGQPVATPGVTFTSEWYEEYDPADAPAPAATATTSNSAGGS
jgi:tetratricopeptide (TPR) repeat protein